MNNIDIQFTDNNVTPRPVTELEQALTLFESQYFLPVNRTIHLPSTNSKLVDNLNLSQRYNYSSVLISKPDENIAANYFYNAAQYFAYRDAQRQMHHELLAYPLPLQDTHIYNEEGVCVTIEDIKIARYYGDDKILIHRKDGKVIFGLDIVESNNVIVYSYYYALWNDDEYSWPDSPSFTVIYPVAEYGKRWDRFELNRKILSTMEQVYPLFQYNPNVKIKMINHELTFHFPDSVNFHVKTNGERNTYRIYHSIACLHKRINQPAYSDEFVAMIAKDKIAFNVLAEYPGALTAADHLLNQKYEFAFKVKCMMFLSGNNRFYAMNEDVEGGEMIAYHLDKQTYHPLMTYFVNEEDQYDYSSEGFYEDMMLTLLQSKKNVSVYVIRSYFEEKYPDIMRVITEQAKDVTIHTSLYTYEVQAEFAHCQLIQTFKRDELVQYAHNTQMSFAG